MIEMKKKIMTETKASRFTAMMKEQKKMERSKKILEDSIKKHTTRNYYRFYPIGGSTEEGSAEE